MKVTQAVISDAGLASRFIPIVKSIPKSFLPLGPKPTMQILVEECIEAGITDIIIVAREDTKGVYEDYFFNKREDLLQYLTQLGKPERYDPIKDLMNLPKVKIITQDKNLPYGTAAPVISAKPYLKEGEPFIYIQGDDVVIAEKRDCQILVEEFERNPQYAGYMMVQEVDFDKATPGGMVKFKDGSEDELDYIVEKPKKEDSPSDLLTYGRYLYTYKIFDYMNADRLGVGGELWNVDALTAMAKEHPVKVIKNDGQWATTGDPLNYLKAQLLYALNDPKMKDEMREYMQGLVS